MKKLSQIEQKIRELVPSTMELTFGCEVRFGFSSARYCGEDNDWIYLEKLNVIQPTREIEKVGKSIKLKILGHPIQLHHVLQAIGKVNGINPNMELHSTQLDLSKDKYSIDNVLWDLTKPLSGQSEELCDFIHQLICK